VALALALAGPAHGADPDLIGQWPGFARGDPQAVVITNNFAYIAAARGGLIVFDVSDPANPQPVGRYFTGGSAYGVAVSGNYAYVADGAAGLQVIDVSNPANPQRVGGYDTSGGAGGVAVRGNYVYVADGEWGLMILGPRTPRITSITCATGTATVYYTNTIPGTNYTLEYRTNLTTGSWQSVGTQPATNHSAFQTDSAAGGYERYYRVYYLTP